MAKKKKSRSRSTTVSGGFRRAKSGFGNVLKSGIVKKAVMGVGSAAIATVILQRVAPQFTQIGSVGAGFLGGGIVGGAINLFLSGGLNQLGGIFGGGGPPQQEAV